LTLNVQGHTIFQIIGRSHLDPFHFEAIAAVGNFSEPIIAPVSRSAG
jgi:hypothetical protein